MCTNLSIWQDMKVSINKDDSVVICTITDLDKLFSRNNEIIEPVSKIYNIKNLYSDFLSICYVLDADTYKQINEIYLSPIVISIGLFDCMNGPNDSVSRYNVENEIKKCVYNRIIDIANFVNKYYKQKLKSINDLTNIYQNKLV